MSLCPNCRRLNDDPGTVHNRGRLVLVRTGGGDAPSTEPRLYACRNCGAVWNLNLTSRSPRAPLPAERWSLRETLRPRQPA